MSQDASASAGPPRGYGFGTFKGVFTPSILTILGVVMYLRMGWVLGHVGLPETIVIVTLASAITFFTALALSALVVMYVITELLLFAVISVKYGRVFNFTAFEAQRREVNAGDDPFGMADVPARLRIRKEVVHPYLGYVYDPSVERSASPHGISDVSPVQHRSPEKVIVVP